MANMKPRPDAWTRFFQESLGALISSRPAISYGEAAIEAALYADKALDVWEQKMNQLLHQSRTHDVDQRPE